MSFDYSLEGKSGIDISREIAGLRIAYVTEWGPYEVTGVLRKLVGQVKTWRELGATAQLYSITPFQDRTPAAGFADVGQVISAFRQSSLNAMPAARLGYANKVASVPRLLSALRKFRPNVIYYRQVGPWYPGLSRIFRTAPTVVEINTDEEIEHVLWGRFFNTLYRATQGSILGRAAGFVSVTRELVTRYERLGKPVAVVANSFWSDVSTVVPPSGNKHPVYVFVGSPMTLGPSWHGTDKLLPLAARAPDCTFHVVGMTAADFPGHPLPSNVVLHGIKSGEDLRRIIEASDVGIGTLALHRKGMQEACPLKVREYLMHRLPVIIAFEEAEAILNEAEFVLRIDNTQDNVSRNAERILEFGRRWCNKRVTADLNFMSREAKELQRLAFLSEFTRGNRS